MANIHDGPGELNLRLSAQDLSELGPDIQNVLRRLAGSQQEQQQRHWQKQAAVEQPIETVLDDFANLNLADRGKAVASSSSPFDVSTSSSPAAEAGLRRQLPQSGRASVGTPTISPSASRNTQSLELAHAPPIANGVRLINPRDVLPDRFREIFSYDLFNAVQSKCFEYAYQTNDNFVVSAPTGSGKTALLELAICRLAHARGNEIFKIVYLCPLKALCTERANDWKQKFGPLAMEVAELTGDTSQAEMRRVRQATIIITTPEKWDSITRSWSDHRKLLDLVELFLIDEVHLLKEPRGSTLEAVVSRMKTRGANVRFVALSATVPNSDDVARWLGRDHTNPEIPARRATFGEEFRPVKLQKFVYGFDSRTNDYQFDTFLTDQLYPHITRHSQKKPILVFCQTRKSCQSSAKKLAEEWNERQPQSRPWPEPTKRTPVISPELQEIVRYGVGFHHAGLDAQDRRAVEQAFLDGRLSVICCTSTLAMGLNLPCHMVVLKGTTSYVEGSISELSDLEFMQMLGRAGRPQFGNSGVAVVLTRARNKQHYEDMGSGQQILESTLHQNLIEHLNSEINLGTFQDIQKAKEWLKGTFLAVRLDRHPGYYKLEETGTISDPLDDRLEKICETDISKLQQAGLVTQDSAFQSTDYGRAMSRYVIRFESMQRILQIPQAAKMEQVLTAVCEADEFRDFRWRARERDVFRELNKSPFIAYPVRGTVNTMAHKASLLLQAALGCVDLSDVPDLVRRQITLDTSLLFERMHRLVRAVIECKASDLDGVTCRVALDLARSMAARAWEGKSMQLTQVAHIGPVFMRKFVASAITTVRGLADAGPSNIERILSRNPPFGKKMADELAHFPRLTLEARIATENHIATKSGVQPMVRIDAILGFSNTVGKPKWRGKIPSVTFLAETTEGVLAHFWRGSMKKFKEEDRNRLSLQFEVELNSVAEEIICHFACEDIVGTVVTNRLQHRLPASAFISKKGLASKPSPTSNQRVPSLTDDDIGDNDLLEVIQRRDNHRDESLEILEDSDIETLRPSMHSQRRQCVNELAPSQDDNPPPTHNSENEEVPWQPIQLPNGKFKCNHRCADLGLKNGNGKSCAHRCCREGLDVPRKPRRPSLKRKAGMEETVVGQPALKLHSDPPNKKAKTETPKGGTPSKSVSRAPLVSTSSNRRGFPVMDLDDFELDADGFIDLTQVEDYHVGDVQIPDRRQYKVKGLPRETRLHNEEVNLVGDLSDTSWEDDLALPIGRKSDTKDHGFDVSMRRDLPHADLAKMESNSTDDFSGGSVFDGISMDDECNAQPLRAQSGVTNATSTSKHRPGQSGDDLLHEDSEFVSSLDRASSHTPQPRVRPLGQLKGIPRVREGSRPNIARSSSGRSGIPSEVGETHYTSPGVHLSSQNIRSRQPPVINLEPRGSEDETYIFSDNYVLPPPRDSLGEGSAVLSGVSNEGQMPRNPDLIVAHNSSEVIFSSPEKNDKQMESQKDTQWQGFEPGFTEEYRDLVELI
ncbi:DEAD/DEAH box DNA helicase [Diaporthe helianthi]|uniref:DNA 3'-5' helicase n=1 Tax=Diaporthe helianthi TaxID=158607 RepID=A0A2P5HU08_DIAHE|nr:DEAD/DEAH box DNA helicase [Diaporthe helianthi]